MFSNNSLLKCALLMGIALFANCKKDSNDTPKEPTAEYYFSAKLDGQAFLYEVDATGNVEMANSIGSSVGSTTCTYSYGWPWKAQALISTSMPWATGASKKA
ncbi:MAG: hypothetical protein ACKVUS_11840 [Saprospiraceae bacterium]